MLRKILTLFNLLLLPRIIWANRSLMWQLTKRNVLMRYKGSALGLVWSFVQPMMMLVVYTFVFSIVFKSRWGTDMSGGRGAFAVIMFCGLSIFNMFSEGVNSGCMSVIANTNYVKKVIFPLEILPVAQVLCTFILGTVWFVLLFIGSVFVLHHVDWMMLLLPVTLIPVLLFTMGVAMFVASFSVFVRDTQYMVGVVLQVLFFMTPIFYPIEAVPERFRLALQLNPLTVLIDETRKVFLYGTLPDWKYLGIALLVSLVTLQLGFFWFTRTKRGFADVL